MKNLFSLLFMCFLSLAVLTSTAQDDKKGSKGGSKGKAKTEKADKKEKPEKKEKAEKTEKKEKPEKKEKADKKGDAKEKSTDKKEKATDKKEKVTDKKEKSTEKVDKKEKKANDKDNTIKPAPKPKNDDGKEADAATKKKVAGADKQIGKDEKGRTIFQGPRGGQYYINSNGNKTYLKADSKL